MPETSSTDRHSSDSQFDWGPPSNSKSESLKEWLVYILLLLVLGLGIWTLLDWKISGVKQDLASSSSYTSSATAKDFAKNKYFVQLVAFADEQSAKKAYRKLVNLGFVPTLHEPDENYDVYRVNLGPFKKESEAENIVEKLNEQDFSCFVVK